MIDKKIRQEFEFNNFVEAIAFVNKVAELSERHNHHPDILIHDYKKVRIELSTHSEGKVTEKDIKLAEEINRLQP